MGEQNRLWPSARPLCEARVVQPLTSGGSEPQEGAELGCQQRVGGRGVSPVHWETLDKPQRLLAQFSQLEMEVGGEVGLDDPKVSSQLDHPLFREENADEFSSNPGICRMLEDLSCTN